LKWQNKKRQSREVLLFAAYDDHADGKSGREREKGK